MSDTIVSVIYSAPFVGLFAFMFAFDAYDRVRDQLLEILRDRPFQITEEGFLPRIPWSRRMIGRWVIQRMKQKGLIAEEVDPSAVPACRRPLTLSASGRLMLERRSRPNA